MSITSTHGCNKKKFFGINNKKKLFIITLIAAIIIENSIILYVSPIDNKIVYTNWILLINSALAAGLSIILVINILSKQKRLNFHSISYITLAIGLTLWFCANSEWVRYEINEVVPDIPSIADFLWISAYPFLGYSLYSTFKKFYKKYQNKKVFLMSLCCGILFVIYIFYITNRLSEVSTSNDIALLSVMIIYPILNTILIVPAIVMLIGFRKEPESSIPHMCESLSLLNLVVADSWFVIIFLSSMVEAIWYSNLLIVDHYLIISAGLLWSLVFLHPINSKCSFEWKNRFKFKNRIPRRIMLILSIPLLLSSIFFVNLIYSNISSYSSTDNNEIKIGALLGLSGISSERGKTQKAAMEEAVKDINEDFRKNETKKKVVLYIEDTERKPNIALAKLKILAEKGIRIIVGPQTSAELKVIKEYIDEHELDILIISQSSTAPSLSKQGDNIFRLVQNDTNQGKEIAKKMYNDGIRVVVPMLRSDAYGNDLYNATKKNFEEQYGAKFIDAITYDPHVGKFAGSLHRINFIMWNQDLKSLSLAIFNVTENVSPETIGVYIIAYGEIVPILIQAQSHDNLKSVNWYGSDGTAKNEHLLKHNKALEFANTTNFLNPLMALNENNVKFRSLENDTKLKELNVYDANAYDALWLAALTENNSINMTIEEVKNKFNKIINSYQGASGPIKLDHNGDRLSNYDFWMLKENKMQKNYEWNQ